MNRSQTWATIGLLIAGPVAANLAFAGLGTAFDYPAILRRPSGEVLAAFRANGSAVTSWFLVLALGAAALAPLAVLVGRLSQTRAMRLAVPVGIAAAAVQVIGLLRWPLLVPGLAARAAEVSDPAAQAAAVADFEQLGRLLGTALGETIGYALTAGWTVLVVVALRRAFAGRWFPALGAVGAGLIALGVLAPLGLPGADEATFVGYIIWSAWLVGFAIALVLRLRTAGASSRDASLKPEAQPTLLS